MSFTRSFLILASTAMIGTSSAMAASYSNFQVTGNNRIDDSIVLGVAGLTPGRAVNEVEANAALQRLYGSGLFSSVELVPSGGSLTIRVTENATVGRVYFEGNSNIDDDELAGIVTVGPRDGLDQAKIEEDAQTIRRYYGTRSRYDVEVNPVVIPVADGVFNVVYEIQEGDVSNVERVAFTGNQNVPDSTLRRTITTGETNFVSDIFSRDNYASEKLVSDQARLENYYKEHGYYAAKIDAVSADYNALGDYYLTYAINEGRQYRFGTVNFSTDIPGVNIGRYSDLVKTKTGKIYKESNVRRTISEIEDQAERDGLPFLRVEPVITPNEATGELQVTYNLTQGPRVYVDRIDIHGNETTLDRVIRRQFDIVEGDPINERKIAEAQRRLEATGYFSRVVVNTRESALGKEIIDVEVEEGKTGSLGLGGSYVPEGGFSAFLQYTEKNFLGRGQYLSTKLELGQVTSVASLSFEEPGLFERDLAAGFDLYYDDTNHDNATYQTTNIGFEPYVRFPLTDNQSLGLRYFLTSTDLRDVVDTVSPLIKAEEGRVLTSGVSATWTWDELNSVQTPTRGWFTRVTGSFAGIGGDDKYVELNGRARVFYPLWGDNVIFSSTLEGGATEGLDGQPVRITDRRFMGGSSFLGFGPQGIGPRDKAGDINSALGGKYYVNFKADTRFPVGLPDELGIYGSVFYQAGSVWGLDNKTGGAQGEIDDSFHMRQSLGAALLWDVGGSFFRFSYALPIEYESYDRIDKFAISLETRF